MSSLETRLHETQFRIRQACELAKRAPEEVTLITVTKNHSAELVIELINLGLSDFGENRDQEAFPKAQEVREKTSDSNVAFHWHFVGQLQTNKVRRVLQYSETIHSLDRVSLLEELQNQAVKLNKAVEVFIQLNLTEDLNRGGVQLQDLERFAVQVLAASNLKLLGVMGVAGLNEEPNREFERILQASAQIRSLDTSAKYISAGMSNDFEVAIQHGATHLRIGSAITGNRAY